MVICASFYLDFRLFKVRSLRSRGGEIPAFARSTRVILHVSTTKTFLRPLVATSALADAFYVHYSRMLFGCFFTKSTFLKIFLLIYPSYTFPYFTERRAGDNRENNGTTPRQQKVLFVNIFHRYWLFSARGFPREFPSVPFRSL